MPLDVRRILSELRAGHFDRFAAHVHPQLVRVLRTIGFNRVYTGGDGATLVDADGNRYLDFMSGWGLFNFGRNHPDIKKALLEAIESDFPGWVAFDAPALSAVLAEELTRRMPNGLDTVYFCNSGTEAAEAAIKFARAATGKTRLVHLSRGFHGTTTGALSVNGDAGFREGFGELLPSAQIEMGDLAGLEKALAGGDVAAFIFEPIQGKGVVIPPPGFLKEAQALCRKHGALLICDEVQTGMGRTGKLWAFEWEPGLDPDLVMVSKALSGGYIPVGAMITRRWIYDKVFWSMKRIMVHATTFSMGNLAMTAGLASLRVIDEHKLLDNANRMGARFKEGLEALRSRFDFIQEIRQRGLMIGIEFGKPKSLALRSAWSMIHAADPDLFTQAVTIPLFEDHRILSQVAGHHIDVVKILPPLIVGDEELRWFLTGFEKVMENLHKFPGPVWDILKRLGIHAVSARSAEQAELTPAAPRE
jgi:ornithine--oxo-acid transaminase